MSKEQIRQAYRIDYTIGYDYAIYLLMQKHHMTEYAADNYLFAEG